MKYILPATNQDWKQLAIFPFKAYVLAAPLVILWSILLWPDDNLLFTSIPVERKMEAGRMCFVEFGYGLCITALLLAIMSNPEDKPARRSALIFMILALLSLILLFPATLSPKFK